MRGVLRPKHRIRLTKPLNADLLVWRDFLRLYNGRTCCQAEAVTSGELELFADAAGSCSIGAILGMDWCLDSWPDAWREAGLCRNLTLLNVLPIVVAS